MTENDNIIDLIISLGEQIDRSILIRLKERGLPWMSATHGKILVYLQKKSRETPVCQMNELARQINRKKNTVTTLIKKLVEKGCVEATQSTRDKRVILVKITPEGEKVCRIFEEIWGLADKACRGKKRDKKIKELAESLNVTLKNLKKRF